MPLTPREQVYVLVHGVSAKFPRAMGNVARLASTRPDELTVALALPPDGYLLACDVSERWTAVARRYWRRAGVDERIDLRLAPAVEALDKPIEEGAEGSFDFAFIDADKSNYQAYLERSLKLVRTNGLIAVDNTLSGRQRH